MLVPPKAKRQSDERFIKNAHQIVVSVEVGFEDKDTGIEAVWPTRIC